MPVKLRVLSSPADAREDEFNQWYDDVQLGEVLALGPFSEVTRCKVSEHQGLGEVVARWLLWVDAFDDRPDRPRERCDLEAH